MSISRQLFRLAVPAAAALGVVAGAAQAQAAAALLTLQVCGMKW
ncbi:MAG TPA: hypothetical protein VLJ57_13270 [Burkholderiaceae bacterium]|nr:hypothetical protein [Burkholderiaceae bacterium]